MKPLKEEVYIEKRNGLEKREGGPRAVLDSVKMLRAVTY
jgi:hypothetical protein